MQLVFYYAQFCVCGWLGEAERGGGLRGWVREFAYIYNMSRGCLFFSLPSPFFSRFFPTTCNNNYNRVLAFSGSPTWMSTLSHALGVRLPLSALSVSEARFMPLVVVPPTPLRSLQLIFLMETGPKTNSVEMITQLRNAGLNVVRMNFSHGTHEVRRHRHPFYSCNQ